MIGRPLTNSYMKRGVGHGDFSGRRCGLTLVELVISMAIMSLIILGISSAILLATRSVPTGDDTDVAVRETAGVVDMISEDLRTAVAVTEWLSEEGDDSGHVVLTLVTQDRDDDGDAERIRYEWHREGGEPAASLTRRVNGLNTATLREDVRNLVMSRFVRGDESHFSGIVNHSAMTSLLNASAVISSTYAIDESNWIAHSLDFELPGNAVGWTPRLLALYIKREGVADGGVALQIVDADENGQPSENVLCETIVEATLLPSSYTWYPFSLDTCPMVRSGQPVCVVIKPSSGTGQVARLQYSEDAGLQPGYSFYTSDGGGEWETHTDHCPKLIVAGNLGYEGNVMSVARRFLSGVEFDIELPSNSSQRLVASAASENGIPLVDAFWSLDFESNPMRDMNGDGEDDWSRQSGSFHLDDLQEGVWNSEGTLVSNPGYDFNEVTDVELRYRCTDPAGSAVFKINADWTEGEFAVLEAILTRTHDLTEQAQHLVVAYRDGSGTQQVLVRLDHLPSSEFVTVRLVIFPDSDAVHVRVNDLSLGTYNYVLVPGSESHRYATLSNTNGGAAFDYVRIQTGDGE